MCDYSLHGFSSRLAVEGEPLVVHRFATRSLGLACPADLAPAERYRERGFWGRIRTWFDSGVEPQVRAVCIPPGARLIVRDIPERLQRELCVGAIEEVTFVQMSDAPYSYRDGIRFENGKEVLLQRLDEGERVDVMALTLPEEAPRESVRESAEHVRPS
jgi:hypothetical protein